MGRFRLKQFARVLLLIGTIAICWSTFNIPWGGFVFLFFLMASVSSVSILFIIEAVPWLLPVFPVRLRRYANMLRANVIDLFSKILAFCTFPFPQSAYNPKFDEGGVPTLFIHGYVNNSGVWFYHKYHYRAAGLRNLFALDLRDPFASIQEHAETVRREIAHIVELTGRKEVRFVCHSMGGVVGAYYALYFAEKDGVEVTDLITMGSPLKGTPMGVLGVGKSPKQMTTNSLFIRKLNKKLEESHIRSFHQGSEVDLLVYPLESTYIDSLGEQKVLGYNDLGHASFLFSDRAISEILSYI